MYGGQRSGMSMHPTLDNFEMSYAEGEEFLHLLVRHHLHRDLLRATSPRYQVLTLWR